MTDDGRLGYFRPYTSQNFILIWTLKIKEIMGFIFKKKEH